MVQNVYQVTVKVLIIQFHATRNIATVPMTTYSIAMLWETQEMPADIVPVLRM